MKDEKTGRPPRERAPRHGSFYRMETSHWLRELVDDGTRVEISLLGGSTLRELRGTLVGFDAESLFLKQLTGDPIMIPRNAVRYVEPK